MMVDGLEPHWPVDEPHVSGRKDVMRWMNTPEVFPRTTTHIPKRTCIATRKTAPQSQLLRVVAQFKDNGDVHIVPDPQRRLPGRGAWITPELQAFEIAEKRRAFPRALKVSANADLDEVRAYLVHKQEKVPDH